MKSNLYQPQKKGSTSTGYVILYSYTEREKNSTDTRLLISTCSFRSFSSWREYSSQLFYQLPVWCSYTKSFFNSGLCDSFILQPMQLFLAPVRKYRYTEISRYFISQDTLSMLYSTRSFKKKQQFNANIHGVSSFYFAFIFFSRDY